MTRQIVPADPIARRRALSLIVGASVLGTLALAVLLPILRQETSEATMRRWLWAAVGFASGGALAAGFYLAWLARRVYQTGQYPVPGQRVVRNTPLRQGPAARHLAWLGWMLAGVLCAAGIALPLLMGRLLRSLGQ